ncbi:MAG TPA: hypothetical protein VGN86_03250 [Pyrinomonadaceae bacterium]|jgi:hypothetical protein|nr:hypothetical protein [Pyrinomonadaceae bacterium]
MTKGSKLLLGAATVWPIFYMLFFFVFIMASVFMGNDGPGPLFAIVIPLHILTMLLMFALTVFYIVNVFRNERVSKDMKVLWAVVIFMGNLIAMPIYWYLYIWRDLPGASAPAQLGTASGAYWQSTKKSAAPDPAYVPPREPPDWR